MTSYEDRFIIIKQTLLANDWKATKKAVKEIVLGSFSPDNMCGFLVIRFLEEGHFRLATVAARSVFSYNKLFQPFTPAVIRTSIIKSHRPDKALVWWISFFSLSARRVSMCIWKALMSKEVMRALPLNKKSSEAVDLLYNIWMDKHGNQSWCKEKDVDYVAMSHRVFYGRQFVSS